jgi:hypothetical protein
MRTIYFSVSILFFSGLFFWGCKKTESFTYKAFCTECKISYYDEKGFFVAQEPASGNFEKQLDVPEFANIMIALQSAVHLDSAAGNPIFNSDVVRVELYKGSDLVCSDTSVGKKLQAVTCSYSWPK